MDLQIALAHDVMRTERLRFTQVSPATLAAANGNGVDERGKSGGLLGPSPALFGRFQLPTNLRPHPQKSRLATARIHTTTACATSKRLSRLDIIWRRMATRIRPTP